MKQKEVRRQAEIARLKKEQQEKIEKDEATRKQRAEAEAAAAKARNDELKRRELEASRKH
jgi:hypothetical protein